MSHNPNWRDTMGPRNSKGKGKEMASPDELGSPFENMNPLTNAISEAASTGTTTKGKKKKGRVYQKLEVDYNLRGSTSGQYGGRKKGAGSGFSSGSRDVQVGAKVTIVGGLKSKHRYTQEIQAQGIRFIIYEKASEEERVLELQWDGPLENPHLNTHYFYRPTAKARRPPSIIQVNSEARWYLLEKKKVYQMANFASERQRCDDNGNWTPNLPVNLYFNPRADIPYLGPNTCMRVLVEFIGDMKFRGIPFSKIAILCSGLLTNVCHDWNNDDVIHGPDEYECELGHAIAGGCSPMQALHGMPKEIAWNNLVPGIPNLKDVFWIVLTHLIDMMSAGQIDNTVGMRNPSCDGLTTGQKNFKDRIERDIELVKSGRGLRCLQCEDLNKWVGEDMPNFHFKSLCPGSMGDDRRIYDSIVIERMEVYKVMWAKGKWLDNVQERYHCGIIVKNGEFPQQQFREVGFQGLPEKVKLAKEAILDRIANWKAPPKSENSNRGTSGSINNYQGRGRGRDRGSGRGSGRGRGGN